MWTFRVFQLIKSAGSYTLRSRTPPLSLRVENYLYAVCLNHEDLFREVLEIRYDDITSPKSVSFFKGDTLVLLALYTRENQYRGIEMNCNHELHLLPTLSGTLTEVPTQFLSLVLPHTHALCEGCLRAHYGDQIDVSVKLYLIQPDDLFLDFYIFNF